MEGIDTIYTDEPEDAAQEEPLVQLATVASVEADGVSLILEGADEATQKHYKCNTAVSFAEGQRVAVLALSGSKVVMFGVGAPGEDVKKELPSGGLDGQVLMKDGSESYAVKWGNLTGGLPSGGTDGQVLLKSGETNYAVKWGTVKGLLPDGGTDGQVLVKSGTADYSVKWGTVTGTLPTGGTDGQVLLKSGATNYATKWGTVTGTLPTGGTDGQVLLKSGATNYAVKWGSLTGGLPDGGTDGQVLLKSGATNYAAKWGTVAGTLPTGGSANQVLLKSSATNYAVKWGDAPAATTDALTSGTYKLRLNSKNLTPSATGFEIGTSTYPVTVRGSSVVLYYSAYKYCTLACNSAGKLTVNGTAVS